jgi:histidinol-phosphate aminotransferase
MSSKPNNLPVPNAGVMQIAPYVGGKSSAGGKPVTKLSSNETPLGPSPDAIKALGNASAYLHRYPDGTAIKLREAIAQVYKLPVERIVCGSGSDELIGMLIHAYAGVGDEILYTQHGFLMYKIYAQGAGATPVTAPEINLRTDVDALINAVTPRTKIVFVANPNNPTGSYISKAEMKRLHDGLPSHVILAIDGAYSEYCDEIPDYDSGEELAASADNVMILRTFSKIYGLAALRLGWGFGPAHIIDALNRIRGPFNVSSAALLAGAAAVSDVAFTKYTREFNNKWLAWLSTEVSNLGLKVYPSIANFILVEFPQGKHNAANANAFLMNEGLIVRDVVAYGLPHCLRISIGLEEDNHAIVKTLTNFLKS